MRCRILSRSSSVLLLVLAVGLSAVKPAVACLLAHRLRVVAPHLTEEEVALYAHGNMIHQKIHYRLAAATPCVNGRADIFTCDGVDLLGHLNLSEIGGGGGNDLWGWTDPVTGTEYAIIGRTNGTSFVDVSDPTNPRFVGNLPSHSGSSSWRDIKTFADHAFVVADGQPHGIQVFDLTQLRTVTGAAVTFAETAHFDQIGNAHNIVINEATGIAYAVGSNACAGGLYMVDVNTPTNPTFVGCFSGDGYTHDAQCIVYDGPDPDHAGREICFASNEDTLTIVDVTNKSNPAQLSRTGYLPAGAQQYAHQGWLTEDRRYFIFDDEFDELGGGHNTRTYVWDVTNLDAPRVAGFWDAPGSSIDHNQYVRGNFTFQANYARGLRILELTDPANAQLTEVGFFDTHPERDGNSFNGAWSTYPFFASGITLVSDINRGLFIVRRQGGDTNQPPLVSVGAPSNGSSFDEAEAITFSGSAGDAEDGDVSSSLSWTSSRDGVIGSGASFQASLSVGAHVVTAAATDSGGLSASAQVSLTVTSTPTGGCLHTAAFEAGAGGWTSGGTCSTGTFVVGVPDATTWQVGGGNPGSAFFTAPNPGGIGTNDVDGGFCEALSPLVDARGEAAVEISLDYFHGQRDAGDDAADGFTVEVLNDGVVVDTPVAIGDVTSNPGWTRISAVVQDPGQVRIRVRATDQAGAGDIVEAGIDNVEICPVAPPPGCSVVESFDSGAAGWTDAPTSTCTTGSFVVATPSEQSNGGVTTQVGGDHTSGNGNALFTATNTSAGGNDVDDGVCVLLSPVFDVATASDLSLWYFHGQRDAGDDANDFFRLELSTDGGSSWSPLVDLGDVRSNAAWQEVSATIAAGSQVRIRVQVSDGAGPGDLVEGGIDDLAICTQ